jgi:hypothetical protein
MFTEVNDKELKPESVYGLVQTGQKSSSQTLYTSYYINCKINVMDRDELHHLNCRVVQNPSRFSGLGKILSTSQMFDPKQRRIAILFDSAPHSIYVFYFDADGFTYFGRKDYAGVGSDIVTGVAISKGKLFAVLEYLKRVDVFLLDDLIQYNNATAVKPRMTINSHVMHFFGVEYFAPVDIKVSRFHNEAIFLKTKTGVMALNVNE